MSSESPLEEWSQSVCHLCQCGSAKSLSVLKYYFASLHYIFMWLAIVSVIGLAFTAISFYTVDGAVNPAIDICNEHSSNFYMCPTCNGDCDFWYLKIAPLNQCLRRFRLLIDNPVMWFYCIVVIASALVLSYLMVTLYSRNEETSDEKSVTTSTSKCCGSFWISVGAIFFFITFFFLYFLLTVYLERKVRIHLHDKNISNIVKVILSLDIGLAIVQAAMNYFARNLYENTIHYLLKDSSHTHRFLFSWTYNSFISYFPILYRIYFYGQIVGDPMKGYSNIWNLRLQHCPSFGCIEVVIYIVVSLASIGGSSFLCCIMTLCKECSSCGDKSGSESGCIKCTLLFPFRKKDVNWVDHYVELNIIYDFTVFFLASTGFAPLVVAFITIAIVARYRAICYRKADNDEEATSFHKVWLWSFLCMTLFSMFTNIAIVIPNSRFIQHIAYSTRDGYHTTLYFDGYLDKVLPQHNLTRLMEIRGFPNFNAMYLTVRDNDENVVKNALGEDILYLPFVDFDCLNKGGYYLGRNFTRRTYIDFIKANPEGNPIIRYRNSQAIAPRQCFNLSSQCQSRGFLENTEDAKHLHIVRSAFVATFALPVIISIVFIAVVYCIFT